MFGKCCCIPPHREQHAISGGELEYDLVWDSMLIQ